MALAGPHAAKPPSIVIWEDAGDEVIVHLASLQVRLLARTIAVSVDFESDETGRAPVIVRFVFGGASDRAGMIAATDDIAHGHAILAARWGRILRDVVWAAVIRTVEEHALERGVAPQAVVVVDGQVRLRTTTDLPLAERIRREPPSSPPRPTKPPPPPRKNGPIADGGASPPPRPRLVKRRSR